MSERYGQLLAMDSDHDLDISKVGKGDAVKRTLFSLVLMLGLILPAATGALAQPTTTDRTFVAELTGDEVDLGTSGDITFIAENYDLRETATYQEEYIWFTYSMSNFQMILIGGPVEPTQYHDITLGNMEDFYDGWELIGEDITDDHSWFLGEAESNGSSLMVYYEFELDAYGDIDRVLMQFTDITTFQKDLEFVQDEVTIGGDPLLPDTDAAELAQLAGSDVGTPDATTDVDDSGDSESDRTRTTRGGTNDAGDADDADSDTGISRTTRGGTDDTDESDNETDSDSDRSRTSRGGTIDSDDEDDSEQDSGISRSERGGTVDADQTNTSETENDSRVGRPDGEVNTGPVDDADGGSTPIAGGDWDAMGLISDTEWESPTYGNTVTWDSATWDFPVDYESAIIINVDPPYDVLTLQTTDGLGYVYISIDQAYDATPTSMIEYWTSDDYAAQINSGMTVVETGTTATSATLVYETTNAVDEPLLVVLEATFLEDGGMIFSQVSAAPDTIHDVYTQFLEGVEFDGAPLVTTFTVEDIQDMTGN